MMNLLLGCLLALLSMNSTITAAALPQIRDGLGAQFGNSQDAVFSSLYHPSPTTNTVPPRAKATAPFPQDRLLEEQALAASKASSATNTTSPNITTGNNSSTHPNSQNIRLQEQAVSLVESAVSAANITIPSTNSRPVKAPTVPAVPQKVGAVPQLNGGGDNGLLAQANGIEFSPSPPAVIPTPISSGPPSASAALATSPSSSSSSSIPTNIITSSSTILPSSTASSLIATPNPTTASLIAPQDNGLQAQDSGSMNIDFDPTHNTTSTNYPHEVHNADGTLVVASVQDSGLQAQDAGGANVVWAPGEAYEGGLGGDVNVPQVVDGGLVERRRVAERRKVGR